MQEEINHTSDLDLCRSNIDRKEVLKGIWKDCVNPEFVQYTPLYPEILIPGSIVFLGLNPSISKDNIEDERPYVIDFTKGYRDHYPRHPHFKKFFDLKDEIEKEIKKTSSYIYMDLLYCRFTQQSFIATIADTDFIKDQAKLTMDIIKNLKPRLVIVCNSLASQIIYNHRFYTDFKPALNEKSLYCMENIPFIIDQSKFLANRYIKKSEKEINFRNLITEIIRVLNSRQ